MIPRSRGIIVLVYFVLITLSIVIRFPLHQLASADKVVFSIVDNEELYLLNILTFGSISTIVDTKRFSSFIEYDGKEDLSLLPALRKSSSLLLFTLATGCFLVVYADIYGETPLSRSRWKDWNKSSFKMITKWWILGFFIFSISSSVASTTHGDENLFCAEKKTNRFSSWISNLVCEPVNSSSTNQLLCYFFCMIYYLVFQLAILIFAHPLGFSHFLPYLSVILISLFLGLPSCSFYVSQFSPTIHRMLSCFSLPLYLLCGDILPFEIVVFLSVLFKLIICFFYLSETYSLIQHIQTKLTRIPFPKDLRVGGTMKLSTSPLLPVIHIWKEVVLVILSNPLCVSLSVTALIEVTNPSLLTDCFLICVISMICLYYPQWRFFLMSHFNLSLHSTKKNSSWKSSSSFKAFRIVDQFNHSLTRRLKHLPDRLFFFLFLSAQYCEQESLKSVLIGLTIFSYVFILTHATHYRRLYISILVVHALPITPSSSPLAQLLRLSSSALLDIFTYDTLYLLFRVVFATTISYLLCYLGTILENFAVNWNWKKSLRAVALGVKWIDVVFTCWIEYHTLCILIDTIITPVITTPPSYFRITFSISYRLAIPAFLIFKSAKWLFHVVGTQLGFPVQLSLCDTPDVLTVKPIHSPSFVVNQGFFMLEGKDEKRLCSMKNQEIKCAWKSKRRKPAMQINKLNLNKLESTISYTKIKEDLEPNEQWTVDLVAGAPTPFLSDECCLNNTTPYIIRNEHSFLDSKKSI